MGIDFSWWGVPGVIGLVVSIVAAMLALRTGPSRAINRRLAAVLLLDGFFMGTSSGVILMLESRQAVAVLSVLATMAMVAAPFQYLAFLGSSLESPLVAPSVAGLQVPA